jgi:hypothetical protein
LFSVTVEYTMMLKKETKNAIGYSICMIEWRNFLESGRSRKRRRQFILTIFKPSAALRHGPPLDSLDIRSLNSITRR